MDSELDEKNLIKSNRIIRGDEIRESKSKEIILLLPDGSRNSDILPGMTFRGFLAHFDKYVFWKKY